MDQNKATGEFQENPVSSEPVFEPEAPAPAPAPTPAPAPSPAPASIFSAPSNLVEKTQEFSNSVKETTTNMVSQINEFRSTSSGTIIAMTIAGILVVGVIALILYYIIRYTMISQSSYLLVETSAPVLGTQITNCVGSSIPNPSSGVRSGMCFWMYIYDISKYQGSVRHVFHRGTKTDSFTEDGKLPEGPYVALDPNSSSLSIVFGPSAGTDNYFKYNIPSQGKAGPASAYKDNNLLGKSGTAAATLAPTSTEKLKVASQSRGIVFPYIPLQRWVHVACVINENLNGGTITGYIDSELAVSVTTSTKLNPVKVTNVDGKTTTLVTPVTDISNINMNNTGDVYIGGSISDPIGPGFSGLVSNIQFYNYDISSQDVYANYQKGPFNNPLAILGLPAYGVRSPLYKIG